MIHGSSGIDFAERLESLKAGVWSAIALSLSFALITLVNCWGLAIYIPSLAELQVSTGINLLVSGLVASLAGFLFGVTYRYVIRTDHNPHLRSGAVLAFGLVRGLAQIDTGLSLQGALLPCVVLAAESLVMFAVARTGLDWALYKGWIKAFE